MSFKFLERSPVKLDGLSGGVVGLALVQCAVAAPVLVASYYRQKTNKTTSATIASRGAPGSGDDAAGGREGHLLSPKIANLVTYGPSAAYAYYASTLEGAANKVTKLLLTHFGKKAVELFVMSPVAAGKGGGNAGSAQDEKTVPLEVAVLTSVYYAVGTYLVANQAVPLPQGMDFDYAQMVFWLGQFGQSFHQYLLVEAEAKQKADGNRSFVAGLPETGGLFKYVAAPQLLFEIVAWVGIAGCARQANAYVQAGMVALLMAIQAKRINDACCDEEESISLSRGPSEGKPPSRKRWNLIPFVY